MDTFRQFRNRYLVVSDLIFLVLAVFISFLLRLETIDWSIFGLAVLFFTILSLAVMTATFQLFGIYSRYWPYASVDEMLLMITATSVATLIIAVVYIVGAPLISHEYTFPRSIPFIFFPIALAVTAGPRFAIRLYTQRRHRNRHAQRSDRRRLSIPKHVLIVGAGNAGSMMVREIRNNPDLDLEVIGFLDDDPRKVRTFIHATPVLGTLRDLERIVSAYKATQVIIALSTAPGKVIREIVNTCERLGVETRTIPAIHEILDDTVSVSQLRNVEIEDLLRRDPVHIDSEAVRGLMSGKRVLITGGGGSIGGELCRQVLRCNPSELIVLGHGENSIFEICNELQRKLALEAPHRSVIGSSDRLPIISPVIADIRFADRLQSVFDRYRPEIVFHAAAHKHVPLMEINPIESASNNVLGTRNLLEASQAAEVERFVMISTDKAVNPTSVMGATKRLAEILVHQTAIEVGKPYVAVRFGNVLGSRGSVVLTFKQQIAAGGPITITHPDMQRFFMTIPEAVQLVLQAAVLGQGGEVFMLDMGEPIKIADLARDLIELSGLEVGRDIDIVYSGVRPGEKLFEELFIPGENYQPTLHEKIYTIAHVDGYGPSRIDQSIAHIETAVRCNDVADLIQTLRNTIPEYRPPVDSAHELPA